MEVLRISQAEMVVYIHPSQSKNVPLAIRRELSSLLFKYDENLDGVVLAYAFNAPGNLARILPGMDPYFAMRLKARLLLFTPKPDMLLEAKAVKITQQSIHAIVLGFASVSIADEDIRNEFRYRTKHGEGSYVSKSHKGHVIKVGTMIRFVVKRLDAEVLHMSGSLIPGHTGSIKWLNEHSEDGTTERFSTKSTRKRGRTDGEIKKEGEDIVIGQSPSMKNDQTARRSKKHKIADH